MVRLRRWADPFWRVIFIYLVLASFMLLCGVVFNLLWYLPPPSYGDDIPFPALFCGSFPFAIVLTGIVFFALNWKANRDDRRKVLAHAADENPAEASSTSQDADFLQ